MPVNYLGRMILSQEEFAVDRDSGGFNPNSNYADYLRMVRSQVKLAEQGKAEAAALGIEVRASERLELTLEDEEILDQIWAEIAEQKRRAAEAEAQLSARAA